MGKPRIFVGSSVEGLDVAYAAQEGLEYDLEVTVWPQGVFAPSRYAMDELEGEMAQSDYALFIFSPDDVAYIRDEAHRVARDNVILELGLFIGGLGRERCFIIVPDDGEAIHLPTDLLGITPITFKADRTDGNIVAALGPACNRIRRIAKRSGALRPAGEMMTTEEPAELVDDQDDIIALLQSWMGRRASAQNRAAIKFADVDRELGLIRGATEEYIEVAAKRWGYVPERKGKQTILFRSER